MTLPKTAQRMLVARQIRIDLDNARTQLAATADPDLAASLNAHIDALLERLHKRRDVVLEARAASLARGIRRRFFRLGKRPRQPVWGFPIGYDPNLMGDRCEICRAINWQPRPIPDAVAWTCRACAHRFPNAATP